jgi:hypothetical protein
MPEQTQKIRIFVASPGDVHKEREHLKAVVDELNATIAPFKKLSLELVKWESHARRIRRTYEDQMWQVRSF